MPKITQLEGTNFVVRLHGAVRNIGTIEDVRISPDRTGLQVTVKLTDEEVAGIFGAAADKAEREASPIGMSNAEIAACVEDALVLSGARIEDETADPGPFVKQDRALGEALEDAR